MENNNEEYEVYYEDNGFNPNGVQNASSDSISIPKTTSSNSQQNMNGFRTNSNNNLGPGSLALGQNKMNRNLPSNSSLGNDNGFPDKSNINNTPTSNNGSNAMPSTIPNVNKDINNTSNNSLNNNSNNNSMPRVNNPNSGNNTTNKANDNASKPKEKSLGNNDKKGFDPRKGLSSLMPGGIANNIRSKLGLGKSNNEDSNDNNDSNGNIDKANDLKQKSMLLNLLTNPKYRVFVLSGGGFIILLFGVLLFIIIIVALTTTTATNLSCDSPSYAVNSSNATEFLCSMSSPFGKEAEGHEYDVSSTSGKRVRPCLVCSSFHEGTDIQGMIGVSVGDLYAVADGVIDYVGWYGGYGNSVLIKHETSSTTFYTRYGHLSTIDSGIKKGMKIKAGTKIGVWGSTGNSTGVHLHFELLDENKKYLSANPFFGYSDQGYEDCLKENSSISTTKCDFDYTAKARHIGQEGFNQICGRTNSYTTASNSNNACCGTKTSSNSGDIFSYISVWEGGTGENYQCDVNGQKGYKAYQNTGDVLTVGPGLTGQYLGGAQKAGDCVAESVVKENYTKAEKDKREIVQNIFKKKDVTLSKHQEDALTSMQYNGCTSERMNNIADAMKSGSLPDVWKYMKGNVNAGTQYELGLKRRRKSEFSLFVTGDYSVETAQKYKSKTWTDSQYNDYDSEGVMAKKMSGSSSNVCGLDSSNFTGNKIIDIATKELNAWDSYSSEDQYCSAVKKYIKACSGSSSINEYCAGFITYVLKEAGVFEDLGYSGTTCVVSDFKKSSKVTVHDANGSYTPKPGDLFIKVDGHGNDWGHIGFVEKVSGKDIHSIEGNTDPFEAHCLKGGSDGDGGHVGSGTIRRKTHTEAKDDITHYISYEQGG